MLRVDDPTQDIGLARGPGCGGGHHFALHASSLRTFRTIGIVRFEDTACQGTEPPATAARPACRTRSPPEPPGATGPAAAAAPPPARTARTAAPPTPAAAAPPGPA